MKTNALANAQVVRKEIVTLVLAKVALATIAVVK